jgi:predicted transcriptional regulator
LRSGVGAIGALGPARIYTRNARASHPKNNGGNTYAWLRHGGGGRETTVSVNIASVFGEEGSCVTWFAAGGRRAVAVRRRVRGLAVPEGHHDDAVTVRSGCHHLQQNRSHFTASLHSAIMTASIINVDSARRVCTGISTARRASPTVGLRLHYATPPRAATAMPSMLQGISLSVAAV